jgi:peptide chain release factor 3
MREAMQQMAEEGVVQVFTPLDGSPTIIGVVGSLQLDVLIERMKAEYNLPINFEMSRFNVARWVEANDPAELDRFTERQKASMAKDLDGAPVFMSESPFMLNYEIDRWPDVTFSDVKDYQRQAE